MRAEGYHPEKRAVTVRGGEKQALRIVLRSPARRAGDSTTYTVWPWVVVGTGGAVAIAGGVLVGLAQRNIVRVEDAQKGSDWSDVEHAYDSTPPMSTAGFVLLGVGAAATTGGLVWHVVARGHGERPVRVSAGLQSVTVTGSF